MDCFSVPHLTVLGGVLVGVEHGEEPELSANAEEGNNDKKRLIQQFIFSNLILDKLTELLFVLNALVQVDGSVVEVIKRDRV